MEKKVKISTVQMPVPEMGYPGHSATGLQVCFIHSPSIRCFVCRWQTSVVRQHVYCVVPPRQNFVPWWCPRRARYSKFNLARSCLWMARCWGNNMDAHHWKQNLDFDPVCRAAARLGHNKLNAKHIYKLYIKTVKIYEKRNHRWTRDMRSVKPKPAVWWSSHLVVDHQPPSFQNCPTCEKRNHVGSCRWSWLVSTADPFTHAKKLNVSPSLLSCGKVRGLQGVFVCFRSGQPPGTDCFLNWSKSTYVLGRRSGSSRTSSTQRTSSLWGSTKEGQRRKWLPRG